MATATQIKALLVSIANGDAKHLRAIALQIAAAEEQKGHLKFAEEIKKLVSDLPLSKYKEFNPVKLDPVPVVQPTGELKGLLNVEYSKVRLNNIIFSDELRTRINRLITEQKCKNKLREFNLLPRNKVLLIGAPGTGKTMTAKVLGGELELPVFVVQLDQLLTKYMGESSSKLRLIFEQVQKIKGIYFFDEFDAIGGSRNLTNDIGEVRRILNTFLQFIEQTQTDSIILAATNHAELLDKALFRRFDDILEYKLPDEDLRLDTFKYRLDDLDTSKIDWLEIKESSNGLSFDEITKICHDIHKLKVLNNYKELTNDIIALCINERRAINKE